MCTSLDRSHGRGYLPGPPPPLDIPSQLGLPSKHTHPIPGALPPSGYNHPHPLLVTSDDHHWRHTHLLLVTSGGDHWRPVETCSLQDLPSPFPLGVTSSGGKHVQFQSGRYASYCDEFLFIFLIIITTKLFYIGHIVS